MARKKRVVKKKGKPTKKAASRKASRKKSATPVADINATQAADSLAWNLAEAKKIAAAAKKVVTKGKFVFFAAFDGTNNDRDNLQENVQTTNVGQLWQQFEGKDGDLPNASGLYCAGLGTRTDPWTESWLPSAVTTGAIRKAKLASDTFKRAATDWLQIKANKGPVKIALTAFSRGAASAAIFSQMIYRDVYRNGLVDDAGKVLLKPAQVAIVAGVLFDPVVTGVQGNQAFPPMVKNLVVVKAMNEYRVVFKAVDYSPLGSMVKTFKMYGNHCDIGGGYDNGLSAVSLAAATRFLQKSGLPVADVPPERQRESDEIAIHGEKFDAYGNQLWDYTADGDRVQGFSYEDWREFDDSVVIKPAAAGSGRKQHFTLYDGAVITA